jgi:hypothetical protein
MALMMETARTSETSVDIQLRTRQFIPEDSELQKSVSSAVSQDTARQNVSVMKASEDWQ